MRPFSHRPDRRSPGPPPAVLALLLIECVAVVVLAVRGVSLKHIAASAGPVITVTLVFLSPTLQELGRRQPKLSVLVDEADADGVVNAPALRPWPIAADRVVTNELATARESIEASRQLSAALLFSGPLAIPPSDDEYERARETFEHDLAEYEPALRKWLTMDVRNKRSGAHAEAVTFVLELPEPVVVADGWPIMAVPPKRPSYQPPRPLRPNWSNDPAMTSSPSWLGGRHRELLAIAPDLLANPRNASPKSDWKETNGGRSLEIAIGEVHTDRSVLINKPVLLTADGPGHHEVGWAAYSKSSRRPTRGTIVLAVSADPQRPAFGRLAGITSYPDVPIGDDEVVHDVRETDPPPRPEISRDDSGDVLQRLQAAGALMRWNALGLDPATDGSPTHPAVRVSTVRRLDNADDHDDD